MLSSTPIDHAKFTKTKFMHLKCVFCKTANNNISAFIDEINKACLDYTPTISDKCNNPNILWLADTNPDVSRINRDKLQQLLQTSPSAFRIISFQNLYLMIIIFVYN